MTRPGLSLSTRLTLAVVVVLAVVQILGLIGFVNLQRESGRGWRLPLPSRIAAAADLLDRTPTRERDLLLIAMNGDQTRFFLTTNAPPGYVERPGVGPGVLSAYGSALQGRAVRILAPEIRQERWRPLLRERPAYAFSVQLADGQRLVVAPGSFQRRRVRLAALLVLNLIIGLAAALLVWGTIRGATRPLQVIAEAADGFAADLNAPPMDEGGPVEARQVALAFNRMRAEIRRLMAERIRMLAAAAHDVKTLLTRLRLRVALIADEAQRDRADRDIALMATLLDDVLLVARGEERPAIVAPVDLPPLLEDMARERRSLGQAVATGPMPGSALVLADAAGLRRVLENLIENAVLYGGGADLELRDAGAAWRVAIVDYGPGLEDAFEPDAFEPFSRGEASRSRETGGTGLGLSIARSLIRQMGGEIFLETTPGGGLTVVVALSAPSSPPT
ncbi:sensor histidine kinase [Brevundimonas sp. P7753]|uniref:sensor histidine kinase n=1 Tax=Brevundimonas sp. P7753 TaxID=2726982 RepID=UPI00351ABC0A